MGFVVQPQRNTEEEDGKARRRKELGEGNRGGGREKTLNPEPEHTTRGRRNQKTTPLLFTLIILTLETVQKNRNNREEEHDLPTATSPFLTVST